MRDDRQAPDVDIRYWFLRTPPIGEEVWGNELKELICGTLIGAGFSELFPKDILFDNIGTQPDSIPEVPTFVVHVLVATRSPLDDLKASSETIAATIGSYMPGVACSVTLLRSTGDLF